MIATDSNGHQSMKVGVEGDFARALKRIFRERRPQRILETGTHLGTGTTQIIGQAIAQAGIERPEFISIEVNPDYAATGRANAAAAGLKVDIRWGLSVPRAMLPDDREIHRQFVQEADPAIFVDHPENARVALYAAETNFPDSEDDLMGKAMRAWGGKVDFVLLDSARHMGVIEFNYFLTLVRRPHGFMLDDPRHVKHHHSVVELK